ncbi:MAG: hypothetical protein ACFFFT_17015 [Candidatus Thorarchaeota archaeon]
MISEQLQILLKTIQNGDISRFKNLIAHFEKMEFMDLSESSDFDKISDIKEKCYYLALSNYLSLMKFIEFEQLINCSDELGIFLEVMKIPFRFKIIAYLHLDGIQKGLTGRIFEIIKFFNKYNLFEKRFSQKELGFIESVKRDDKALLGNLKNLFGKVSDSLIFYSCKLMPYDLYLMYVERAKSYLTNKNRSQFRGRFNINFLKQWTDWYSMYGLNVRNLGAIEQFIEMFEKNYIGFGNKIDKEEHTNFIEFNAIYRSDYYPAEDHEYREVKKHFLSPENILKNKENILKKDEYKFYSLSMVLLGGLGPEGLGLTYSTPRGEVVEICSDQKETEAIIIKFKQYLKRRFLDKLDKEMTSLGIEVSIREKIIDFLSEIIKPTELIGYYNKNAILRKIKNFLYQIKELEQAYKSELEEILNKISVAISIILRKIKLKDQFITRMDLVAQGKIKSEDIAKLTKKVYYYGDNYLICFACGEQFEKDKNFCPYCNSPVGKTHYDVLQERFFFQNEIKWFFNDYTNEINDLERKFLIS